MKFCVNLFLLLIIIFTKNTYSQVPVLVAKTGPIVLQLDLSGKCIVRLSDIATLNIKTGFIPVLTFTPKSFTCADIGKQKIKVQVTLISTIPPTPAAVSFTYPTGVALDNKGNLYVSEDGHDIRKIDETGQVTTFAGNDKVGYVDGPATTARFNTVIGITVDALGNIYVTDTGNNCIRKINVAGVVSTVAGSGYPGSTDGIGNTASFNSPTGITIDRNGNLYVVDNGNNTIRKISLSGSVTTIAGNGIAGYAEGKGINASFNSPNSICIDLMDNLYVTDGNNFRIRKINPDGQVSTFAGNGIPAAVDGTGTSASFTNPFGIAIDGAGNIYVGNEKFRKISPSGKVTTIAGSGKYGSADGTSSLASFQNIQGICFGDDGTIYAADFNNNKIRMICPNQSLVSTLAGSGSLGTDNGNVGVMQNCNNFFEISVPVMIADSLGTCALNSAGIINTFTPNGDGINDFWTIPSLTSQPDCTVSIFNRFGQLVFQSKGYPKPWEGKYFGKPLPVGTYYYLITLGKSKKPLSGNVTILK